MRRNSNAEDLQRAIEADLRAVTKSFVGKPMTPALRLKVQRQVMKVLRKYREVGLPIDVVRAFRDLSNDTVHVRVVQKDSDITDVLKPLAPVYDLDRYRQIKKDMKEDE